MAKQHIELWLSPKHLEWKATYEGKTREWKRLQDALDELSREAWQFGWRMSDTNIILVKEDLTLGK